MLLKFTKMFKTMTSSLRASTRLCVQCVLLIGLLICSSDVAYSQLRIGGDETNIDDGSILELDATDRAFIPPRMTTAQRDGIPTPLCGAIIFNKDTNCLEVNKGSDEIPIWECIEGQVGPQGPTGATGSQGPAGATGEQGKEGPSGPQGAIGPAGPQGATAVSYTHLTLPTICSV